MTNSIKYASLPPVSKDFFMDFDSKVSVLGGPIGSGKTFSQCLKILVGAISIKPDKNGVRKTRFIVARKRYGDLEASFATDMETLVAPGVFKLTGKKSPMLGSMKFPYTAPDGQGVRGKRVDCEIYMYAFETLKDVAKIKSIKFTAGVLIEAQEFVDSKVYKKIFERLGRYPTPDDVDNEEDLEVNTALTWHLPWGVVSNGPFLSMDINYPDVRHHFKKYIIDDNPMAPNGVKLRKLYKQPPTHIFEPGISLADNPHLKGVEGKYKGERGVFVRNPEAEPYIKHNKWAYWEDQLREMMGDDALIQQNILGEFGDTSDGKPVYPRFRRSVHVASTELQYRPGLPVYVGADNGFNNAWIFCQQLRSGMIHVIHEIANVGDFAKTIAAALEEDILPYINEVLPLNRVVFILDQAFYSKEGGSGSRQVELLDKAGLNAKPCPEKQTSPMRELVTGLLASRQILINERCSALIDGMAGGFHYPINNATGLYREEPNQNSEYSHPVNAFEFVCAGLSKGNKKRRTGKKKKKSFNYI